MKKEIKPNPSHPHEPKITLEGKHYFKFKILKSYSKRWIWTICADLYKDGGFEDGPACFFAFVAEDTEIVDSYGFEFVIWKHFEQKKTTLIR